jgi:uncharacterized protein YcbX
MSSTVTAIWRYPVKSMRGEALRTTLCTARGLPADRRYALVDAATGKVASAKLPRLWRRLLECRAEAQDAAGSAPLEITITLPDGRRMRAGSAGADACLSALLDRPVALAATPPPGAQLARYWPDVEGLAQRNVETSAGFGEAAPEGTFFDYAPLHLITTATLSALAAGTPGAAIDPIRFRPNLLIALDDEQAGFVENAWVGRTVEIGGPGGTRLRITDPTPRCVIPTLAQGELPNDIRVLRAIAVLNRPPVPVLADAPLPCAGVYAQVEQPGRLHVGDPVRLL